jgi:hypothetical protein
MDRLMPLFARSGVKVLFAGHEHNFQHSVADGVHYFITGAAGKLRRSPPDRFDEAHTVTWATECHFLLATIGGDKMTVRALSEIESPDLDPVDITRLDPQGRPHVGPMEIFRSS